MKQCNIYGYFGFKGENILTFKKCIPKNWKLQKCIRIKNWKLKNIYYYKNMYYYKNIYYYKKIYKYISFYRYMCINLNSSKVLSNN